MKYEIFEGIPNEKKVLNFVDEVKERGLIEKGSDHVKKYIDEEIVKTAIIEECGLYSIDCDGKYKMNKEDSLATIFMTKGKTTLFSGDNISPMERSKGNPEYLFGRRSTIPHIGELFYVSKKADGVIDKRDSDKILVRGDDGILPSRVWFYATKKDEGIQITRLGLPELKIGKKDDMFTL